MENSPFAFLASLTGKPAGEAFASGKSFLERASGQEVDRAEGEGFLSFLEGLLTPAAPAEAQTLSSFAASPVPAAAPFAADASGAALAPSTAPVDNISMVAAPVEGLTTPVIDAAPVQGPANAAAALAPSIPAQSRVDAKTLPVAQSLQKPQSAAQSLAAPATTPPASGAGDAAPAAETLTQAVADAPSEQAPASDPADQHIPPRNARVQSAPAGVATNGAATAPFALADNAAPEGLAHAAPASSDSGVLPVEASAGRRLEIVPAHVTPVRDQIAAAVASKPGEPRLEVRLDPPELGKVTIIFDGDGADIVRAVVHADTPQTLDLMRRHADIFQRALEDQGFHNLDLQFSDRAPQEHAGEETQRELRNIRIAEDEAALLADITAPRLASGRLDRRM